MLLLGGCGRWEATLLTTIPLRLACGTTTNATHPCSAPLYRLARAPRHQGRWVLLELGLWGCRCRWA
jgi:hypothetical protein